MNFGGYFRLNQALARNKNIVRSKKETFDLAERVIGPIDVQTNLLLLASVSLLIVSFESISLSESRDVSSPISSHEKIRSIEMANIQEMAEAHLRNVQQQIQDLQGQKEQIDKDIQMLSDYLQQGVAELESVNNVESGEVATDQ